jgi:chromosome segregation ATPase
LLRQELAELETYYGDLLQRSVRRVEGLLQENETLKAEYSKLLESSSHIKASREKEIAELRSQLATERADREEIESELADLKQKPAPIVIELPDAADLLKKVRKALGKKSTASLADVELILEMIEG